MASKVKKKKARAQKKHRGVFVWKGKGGTSYGIDYTHPATGARIQKILKGCQSEAEAAELRAIEIADAARGAIDKAYGLKPKGAPVLFSAMVDEYLKLWSAANKDSRTDKQRAAVLKRAFNGKLMSDISPWMIERFKMSAAKTKAKTTINKYLSFASQVYEKAREWKKYPGENPFLKAERFKVKRGKKPGCLSPEQVRAIMSEIKHDVKRAAVEFGFNTGWRISEILSLKWSEVNFEKGAAWILNPKNAEPVEIELNDRALEIIREQERRGEYVFSKKNGDRFKTGIHQGFKLAAIRAGVELPPRKAWHILRRTWATLFLQAGGDVETLRALGNWKDYSMPMWYAEAADVSHKKKILNRLPRLDAGKLLEIETGTEATNRKNK